MRVGRWSVLEVGLRHASIWSSPTGACSLHQQVFATTSRLGFQICKEIGGAGLLHVLRRVLQEVGSLLTLRRRFPFGRLKVSRFAKLASTSFVWRPRLGLPYGFNCSLPCASLNLRWCGDSGCLLRFICLGVVPLLELQWKSFEVLLWFSIVCQCPNLMYEAPFGIARGLNLFQHTRFLPPLEMMRLPVSSSTSQAAIAKGLDCFSVLSLSPFLLISSLKCNLPSPKGFVCKTGSIPVPCALSTLISHVT